MERRRAFGIRGLAVASALVAVCLVAPSAGADEDVKEACANAYDQSQDLRDQGKLLLARAQLAVCQAACPAKLTPDCDRWRAEVEARLPSIVPIARGLDGRPLEDARVFVDGKIALERADGRALDLDPGRHTVRFERDGAPAVQREIVVSEGQRSVEVVGELAMQAPRPAPPPERRAPPPRPPPPSPQAPSRALPLVIGGIGAIGLALGGALTLVGHVERQALYECKPSCDLDDLESIRATWTVAGVSAGIGGACLGIAALLWLSADPPQSGAATAWRVGPAPLPGGGLLVGARAF